LAIRIDLPPPARTGPALTRAIRGGSQPSRQPRPVPGQRQQETRTGNATARLVGAFWWQIAVWLSLPAPTEQSRRAGRASPAPRHGVAASWSTAPAGGWFQQQQRVVSQSEIQDRRHHERQ